MGSDGDATAVPPVPPSGAKEGAKKASWLVTQDEKDDKGPERLQEILTEAPTSSAVRYAPLLDTLRLYAGWLLAWYFMIYALAGYQVTRPLPFRLSLLDDFIGSALVAQISAVLFLFLLLTSLHRAVRGKNLFGILLTLLGLIGILLFSMNIR
ncbi:MAG: hypothetical protein WCV62_03790 [Candidatus Peribacteraceae bacterium]|jgi:hypothetical protein